MASETLFPQFKLSAVLRPEAAAGGDDGAAALAILARPIPGMVADDWIEPCAELMRTRFRAAMDETRRMADLHLDGTFPGFEKLSDSERRAVYEGPLRTKRSRGRLAGILARCWRVYGERRYLDGCLASLRELAAGE
ncbi:MAG: hypothetical protein ABIF71_09970 [Planctomycetota bacterium]